MADSLDSRRRFAREQPTQAVQVTAERELGPPSPGEAVNLSAGGACLVLASRELLVGDELILWLSFARPRQPVPATARVVWASAGSPEPRYGVEWTHQGPQRSWIDWAAKV